MKTNKREKILRDASGKKAYHIQRNKNYNIFLSRTMKIRRKKCSDILKILEEGKKNLSSYIFIPNKNIFPNLRLNSYFLRKQIQQTIEKGGKLITAILCYRKY